MNFYTDITALRRRLDKDAKRLRDDRSPYEDEMREIRDHFEPKLGRALDGVTAEQARRQNGESGSEMLSSEPRISLHRLAAGLFGSITNPSTQWFELTVDDRELLDNSHNKRWLDGTSREMRRVMAMNNTYAALAQIFLRLPAFADAGALIVPDRERHARIILSDNGAYWLGVNANNEVDRMLRQIAWTYDQITEFFGEGCADSDKALRDVRDSGEKSAKRDRRFVVNHYVFPADGSISPRDVSAEKLFYSVYWREGSDAECVLDLRGYGYNPIIAPRWMVVDGAYGFGPGHMALGDAKELQRMEEDKLRLLALEADPPVTAPADLAEDELHNYPGGVTRRSDSPVGGDPRPLLAPLYQVKPDLAAIGSEIREVARRIDRVFFADLMAVLLNRTASGREMTAAEVMEISKEKMTLLGPVLSRMDTDLLNRVVEGHYHILAAGGKIAPPPRELEGAELRIRYISILHSEQQAATVLGRMGQAVNFIGMVAQAKPEALDKLNADEAVDVVADALSLAPGVVNDDRAVGVIRAKREAAEAAAAQRREMIEAAPGAGRAVRDLSEARLRGGGSALDRIAEAGGVA